MPEWIGGPILAAIIAALGYVANLAINTWLQWRRSIRERQARLVVLQSLLLASHHVFELQAALRNQLCEEFQQKDSSLKGLPYDEVLARGYLAADPRQKLVHGLIRQYTISAMRPLNQSMLEWLTADTYYKVNTQKRRLKDLSLALRTLEAHLILWRAKFEFWIPDKPERALVYMADESEHGIGFPIGLDELVGALTGGTQKPV